MRIITPGIPDKKYVYLVTRSFYPQLARAGVRIYEYTPGFLHGKMIVSDDDVAVVGTINMDFRSFFLHFECGTVLYGGKVIGDIKRDMLDTLAQSREIDQDWFRHVPWASSVMASILRLLSPSLEQNPPFFGGFFIVKAYPIGYTGKRAQRSPERMIFMQHSIRPAGYGLGFVMAFAGGCLWGFSGRAASSCLPGAA